MDKYIIISILLCSLLFGQEILDKENAYLKLQSGKENAEQHLDSLNQSLDVILKKIDEEKSKNKEKAQTTSLMSSALSVSKKIENKEDEIKILKANIAKLERELNAIYSKQMAKLEQQLNGDISNKEKEKVEQELMLLAEKRMRTFPLFHTFKFNPTKINSIHMDTIKDDLEKEISMDYLKSALAQIDSNIHVITEKTEELEDNKRLEDKANLFMDDIADSRIIGFYESDPNNAAEATNGRVYISDPIDNEKEWGYIQSNSIANTIDFLSQLEFMGMPFDENINRFKISPDSPLDSEEYLEILKSSRDFLKIYRNMLVKKISGE